MKKFTYGYYEKPEYRRIHFNGPLPYQKCRRFIQEDSKYIFYQFMKKSHFLNNKNAFLYLNIISI